MSNEAILALLNQINNHLNHIDEMLTAWTEKQP